MRTRYRFSHAGTDALGNRVYYWYSGRIPGDSRVEQIRCRADWFWQVNR